MSDRSTLHFARVVGKSLSRLTALIEQAAAVLDQRGSLRVRTAILKELHFALGTVQAIHTSETWDGMDESTLIPFLNSEIDRMRGMVRGKRPRPALRIVGGTDMEGVNGDAA
jgi:hypothetical protein